MRGYLLNFYKFSPTVADLDASGNSDFFRSIVWSDFDRVEIRDIDEFDSYRVSEKSEKNWLGERQFVMIYEFNDQYNSLRYLNEEERKIITKDKNDEKKDMCKFAFDLLNENAESRMRFFGITLMDFTPQMHQYCYKAEEPGKQIHNVLLEMINEIIEKNNIESSSIAYEVYGVLGAQDAVIIWLAYQFEDIAKVLEGLRKSKAKKGKGIIANVYTIIGLKDVNDDKIEYRDVKGRLHIKLTKKETFDDEKWKSRSKIPDITDEEKNNYILFGEHDSMITMPGESLVSALYMRGGMFNSNSRKFQNEFIQSRTEVIMQVDCNNIKGIESLYELSEENIIEAITPQKIENYIKKIEKILKCDCFQKTEYLQETLWLLYEEFLKNRASSFSYPWIHDLEYQFENCLEYLIYLGKSNLDNNKKYKNIHGLIASMRQMMLHVAQTNRIFFEIPNMHLRYTGAYSKILRTYYGVLKQYLQLLYSIPRYDKQAPIIPFIVFDVTPKVKSKFLDRIEGYDSNIVRFELPYEALVDIPKYNKLLAHEIYHYIAPVDRVGRNKLVAIMSFVLILGQMCTLYLRELALDSPEYAQYVKTDKVKRMGWENCFKKITIAVEENILRMNNIEEVIESVIPEYKDNDEWSLYFNKFMHGVITSLKKNSSVTQILFTVMKKVSLEMDIGDDTIVFLCKKIQYLKEIDLIYWLERKKPVKKLPEYIFDFCYSLREAMADYFMIQIFKMDVSEYLKLVRSYQNMFEEKEMHIRIWVRIALILDLFWGESMRKEIEIQGRKNRDILKEVSEWIMKKSLEIEDVEKIAEYYTKFIIRFNIYYNIIEQFFDMLNLKKYDNEEYYPEFTENFRILKKVLKNVPKTNFEENIYLVEMLQDQKNLMNLSKMIRHFPPENRVNIRYEDIIGTRIDIKVRSDNLSKTAFPVESFTELIKAINAAIENITESNDDSVIWFRGQESVEYILLPSIYRMKDKSKQFYNTSMRKTMKSLLDLFKAKSYNAPELIGTAEVVDTNCLSTMQHYKMPTNIMDWTTSAFTALYFALEKEFNHEDEKVAENAVIYLLNPIRLNLAREHLMKPTGEVEEKGIFNFPIPALVGNSEDFKDYLPSFNVNECKTEYPIAVYAPFVNQRIKAQLGTFTMFGLDNKGKEVIDEDGKILAQDFSLHSLEEMQDSYKKTCDEKNSLYKPFLEKVEIQKEKKEEIARNLYKLGIQKKNIYPELDNISEELMEEVKAYFKQM